MKQTNRSGISSERVDVYNDSVMVIAYMSDKRGVHISIPGCRCESDRSAQSHFEIQCASRERLSSRSSPRADAIALTKQQLDLPSSALQMLRI